MNESVHDARARALECGRLAAASPVGRDGQVTRAELRPTAGLNCAALPAGGMR